MLKGLERFAPLAGVVAVALWIIGAALLWNDAPADDGPSTAFAAYFDDKSGRILLSAFIFGVGSAAFIWFVGTLAARLRAAAGEGRLASIMLASGTAAAALFTMVPGTFAAGALAYENLDRKLSPDAAEALWVLGNGFFVAAEVIAVAFLGAAAVAILRTRFFPTWFGWLTALAAIVLVIGPIGWAVLLFGIPIWTLVTSAWLFMRKKETAPAAA